MAISMRVWKPDVAQIVQKCSYPGKLRINLSEERETSQTHFLPLPRKMQTYEAIFQG